MSKPSWEEFRDSFVASIESGASVQEATEKATGSSGGYSGSNANITPNNGRTSGGYAHQSYTEKQSEIKNRNQKSYAESAKNADNSAFGSMLKDAIAADEKRKEEAAKHDNSAGWQQIKDNSNSLEAIEKKISDYNDAVKDEDKASQYIGTLYSSEGAEENLASARANREAIAKDLEMYGVKTNGTQVDASSFYEKYFGEQTKKAKEEKGNEPIDIVGLLTGLESSYSANKGKQRLTFASDDENLTYEYLKKQDEANGTNRAEVYERYLEGLLNQREGQAKAEEIMSRDTGLGRALGYGTQAFKSGLSGALIDTANLFGADAGQDASQYAAGILGQDLQENGSYLANAGFAAAQSTGAMIPGIVAGMVNPVLGKMVFATTSGASAYQEKMSEGWMPNDAAAYGALIGAAEAGLESLLGGIAPLAKNAPVYKLVKSALPKVDNALLKASGNAAVRAAMESGEEGLQAYLAPAIEAVIAGVPYDAPEFEEVLFNAVVGAVTSVGLGGGEFIGDIRQANMEAAVSRESADKVINAKTISELVTATSTSSDMDKASARVRSDEAMLNELQQTVGRPLNGNNDVKAAILELQMKAAIEQKISAAVAEGTPQAIEKALMDIANNPRELNVLNKYYGNLPSTVEGNIDFAKQIANPQPTTQATEPTVPAEADIGQETRDIIDQVIGIAPVAEQTTEGPIKVQEVAEGQVTPATTQEAEQMPPERLNQQENSTEEARAEFNEDQALQREYNDARLQAEKDYGAAMEKWYAQHPEQEAPPVGHYLGDKTKWVKERTKVILKKLHGDKYTDEYFDRINSIEVKNSILGNINMSLEEKVEALKDAGVPGEWIVDNGRVVNAETQGKRPKTENEEIEDILPYVLQNEITERKPENRAVKLSYREDAPEGVGTKKTAEMDAADKALANRLESEKAENDKYKLKTVVPWEEIELKRNLPQGSGDVTINEATISQENEALRKDNADVRRVLENDGSRTGEESRGNQAGYQENAQPYRGQNIGDSRSSGQRRTNGAISDLAESGTNAGVSERSAELFGDSWDSVTQPLPSKAPPSDDAELTALQMDEEREAANSDAELYQKMAETKAQTNSSGQYTQQQRDAEREAQRQREQEGLPKYDVAREYGDKAVKKFGEIDGRLGKLVDEQRVFRDGNEEGTKTTKTVARLNNGKEILNMARGVMRGEVSMQDFVNEYNDIKNTSASYLWSESISDAFQEAVLDVSPTRNTEYTQVTQEKKAKDIVNAMQMLAHRAEQAADLKTVSSNLSKQIRSGKSKASKIALNRYFSIQATPDTMFKAIAGFKREGNTEAYALADEALENNATEKRERSAGYSFFTDVTKHKDFEAFAKNKLISGYEVKVNGETYELTAQEAVSLLHSLRSIREQTKDYKEGHPDQLSIDRDGKVITIADIGGQKVADFNSQLRDIEADVEAALTGIAKEYSEALDKMFAHYSPKFIDAIKKATGLDREAAAEGKYFPLFYRDGGGEASFNIADALQSRFDKLGFAKERVGPGNNLRIAPAAQIADNYIEQVSHYIGWVSFSKKLEMLNSNIDGAGSFLSTISDVYSEGTAKLFADYIRDVGGYKTADSDNFMNQLLGKFAGAVITGRPSTAFSQLSSVYAAGGIIKPEAIRQAGIVFPAKQKHVNLDDGLLADRARHGINDSTISEISRNADSKIKNAIEKIPGGKTYLNLVGIADAYTTKQLYAACWCDVRMDYPDIQKRNPKLFDTLVEDKFMEAVLFSQSDSDRINNAAIYRSNNYWYRATSLFTGQPNKQLNMVMTALGEYNAAKGDAKKEAAETLKNTVRGQAGAAVSYAVLKTVASLILHKWYDLKDEDDELSVEEIGEAVLSESISTMFGMLRFGEWTTDRLMHLITDGNLGNDFDFQINGISQMFGLAENAMNILGIANGNVPTVKEIKDFAVSVSNVTGAPLQGAYDFANMLSLWGVDIYNAVVKGEKPKGNYDITKVIDRKISADRELSVKLTGKTGLGNAIDALLGNEVSEEREGAQDALTKLYEETGKESSLPPQFDGKINDDIKLSGNEKEAYQDELLDIFYGNFEQVYNESIFKNADTETQQAIVGKLKEFATDQAKQEYYDALGLERESNFKTLLEGKVVPGKEDDNKTPKPDIPALDMDDIPTYLANQVIYAQAQKDKDYDAIDDFLKVYDKMSEAEQMQFANSNSEIKTLIRARDEFGIDSENYYKVMDSIEVEAVKYDETAENAKSKMSGIYNANVSDEIKDMMAQMKLSEDALAFFMAAKETGAGDPTPIFANTTFNDNTINQAEAKIAVQNDPKLEELMKAWWKNKEYKTGWDKKKVTAEDWEKYYDPWH